MNLHNGIVRLSFYEEAVGSLHELALEEGLLVARIGNEILALPPAMEGKLQPFLRQRIAILRTDILGKEYLVRVIPEAKADHEMESDASAFQAAATETNARQTKLESMIDSMRCLEGERYA